MSRKDFATLIARIERAHAIAPEFYRLKVMALACLGLAYPSTLALACICSMAGLIWAIADGDILLALGGFLLSSLTAWMLLPLLAVRRPQIKGRILSARSAPKLFVLVDKVRGKTRGPRIDEIRLSDEFGLRTVLHPRLGVLGFYRITLIVGLPLLQILSRKEFAALLAHEIGHLPGKYSRLSAWVYRQRSNWVATSQTSLASDISIFRIPARPLSLFTPYFEAFGFVMARQSEYHSDRIGGRVVGKRLMADALISYELGTRFLEENFWPVFWSRAADTDTPPNGPHASIRTAFNATNSNATRQAWLSAALKARSDYADTHPSLYERLLALDQNPELPPCSTYSAAQALLGQALPHLIQEFDEAWFKSNATLWSNRHEAIAKAHELVALFSQYAPQDLLAKDQCRYGLALQELGRTQEALTLLKMAADQPEGSAQAAMAVGQILREAHDEAAIHYFELAMSKDARLAVDATQQVASFYSQSGDREKALAYQKNLLRVA